MNALKIQYEGSEIQKREPEPTDVRFWEVHFQVMEKLEEGYLRDAEWREREKDLRRTVDTGKFEYCRKAVEGPEP